MSFNSAKISSDALREQSEELVDVKLKLSDLEVLYCIAIMTPTRELTHKPGNCSPLLNSYTINTYIQYVLNL